MLIRSATQADWPSWAEMLSKLHPEQSAAEFETELETWTALPEPYVGFLAFTSREKVIGMVDARVRNYAEGSPQFRAAYVEDLWVDPEHRRSGIAKLLLAAVESWARDQRLSWLGSDTDLGNVESQQWHLASGFDEVERLTVFGKSLT